MTADIAVGQMCAIEFVATEPARSTSAGRGATPALNQPGVEMTVRKPIGPHGHEYLLKGITMNKLNPILLAALLGLSSAAVAPLAQAQQAVISKDAMSEGEIRKVDKDLGKLTIKHGELKNLGMGAMTMVFRAKEPAMLDQVKQGDKVRFVAELVGGALTVTSIQTAN